MDFDGANDDTQLLAIDCRHPLHDQERSLTAYLDFRMQAGLTFSSQPFIERGNDHAS